ncbi:MAG: glycosyltransferase [Bacteroidetes bacterium]|nr:glycosyltransferase [Bacteroidota bacterium]
MLSEFTKKTILICPLNWGLGHATRCIPIIKELEVSNRIIIASDGIALDLLKAEFPHLTFMELPAYNVKYYNIGMLLSVFMQLPKIFLAIFREHIAVKKIRKKYSVDVIISDNRYGLWDKSVRTIFITHQIYIRMPFFKSIVNFGNRYFIGKFNECWIPDYVDSLVSLSGDLSHGKNLPTNCKYINPLSRFSKKGEVVECKYDIAVVLSGPEPQRTNLEKEIAKELYTRKERVLVVRGTTNASTIGKWNANTTVKYLVTGNELETILSQSKVVVARSGYSTIMDLHVLHKKALLIPTPGQTEQEYLAEFHKESDLFVFQKQNEIDFEQVLNQPPFSG